MRKFNVIIKNQIFKRIIAYVFNKVNSAKINVNIIRVRIKNFLLKIFQL